VKRRELAPTLSKLKVKRICVFQTFSKTNQNEVKPFKIVQDRSKTNVFVSDCEGEEKRKKANLRFFFNKAKKNEYNRSTTIEDLPLLLPGKAQGGGFRKVFFPI
jgi:hypothetical protein